MVRIFALKKASLVLFKKSIAFSDIRFIRLSLGGPAVQGRQNPGGPLGGPRGDLR